MVAGFGIQGIAKIYTFLVRCEDMYKINKTVRDFHKIDFNANIRSILDFYSILAMLAFKITKTVYLATAMLIALYPVVVFIATNEIILHFGFILPLIDENTTHGYTLNVCHHILQMVLVIAG